MSSWKCRIGWHAWTSWARWEPHWGAFRRQCRRCPAKQADIL